MGKPFLLLRLIVYLHTEKDRILNYKIMKTRWTVAAIFVITTLMAQAQSVKKGVYNEQINPLEQIDDALSKAKSEGKFVICQVGGNWCPWCLRFADFITADTAISKVIDEHFIYIHVNYNPRKSSDEKKTEQTAAMLKRLGNPARFGFPVFVVLKEDGKVLHIQDSSFLEEGQGYDQKKVLRFFKNWTPEAVK